MKNELENLKASIHIIIDFFDKSKPRSIEKMHEMIDEKIDSFVNEKLLSIMWNKYSETKPTESGRYLVVHYGKVCTATWNEEYKAWDVKWIEDEDGDMIDIVYNESNVTYWCKLPDKPI